MRRYLARFFKWIASFFEVKETATASIPDASALQKLIEGMKQQQVTVMPIDTKIEPVEPEVKLEEVSAPEGNQSTPEITESEDEYNVYNPKERLIYKYWNGKEMIKADPMTLYKKIMDVGPTIAIHHQVSKSQSKDAKAAHDSLIEEVRKIFGVYSLEDVPDTGLGQVESLGLMNHFLDFVSNLKKNSRISQIQSSPSEDSIPTLEENDQLISNTSDSGSTGAEPSTESPPQYPLERE